MKKKSDAFSKYRTDAVAAAVANIEFMHVEGPKEDEWRPVSSALSTEPVWVTNKVMRSDGHAIIARRGYGGNKDLFTVVADPLDKVMPMPPGCLCCPSWWQPVVTAPRSGT